MRRYPNKPLLNKLIGTLFVVCAVLLMIILGELAHGSTQPRPNNLGVYQIYDSPYTYMVGSPVSVEVFEEKGQYYTEVKFKAFGASMLNTQELLFCGNEEASFSDSHLRAMVYRVSATRLYQRIGCHDLLRVLLVKEEK